MSKQNIDEFIEKYDLLVCCLRPSRNKSKQLAILEMSVILSEFDSIFICNGPLGDVRGTIAFFVNKGDDIQLKKILSTVGYCNKFYKLDFSLQLPDATDDIKSINQYFWKGHAFQVIRFYLESDSSYREHSIENRLFAIYQSDNTVKYVKGYRGNGSETGRRGLPVEDMRLMVNLVNPYSIQSLMDPFAGSGGIIYTAKLIRQDLRLISADIDRILEPGLRMYSDCHYTCDAKDIDLKGNSIDAVVTEIPFSRNATEAVIHAFLHLIPSISEHGKLLLMCHVNQTSRIKKALQSRGLYLLIERGINRKGTPVDLLFWSKDKDYHENTLDFFKMLQTVV